jgi:transmembrane sensor
MEHNPDSDDFVSMAADWHNRLEGGDASAVVRAEFDAWLAADPRHREAFDAVDQMWENLAAAGADPRIMELRRKALSATSRSTRFRRFAVAAAVFIVVGGAAWFSWHKLLQSQTSNVGFPHRTAERIEGGSLRTALGERANATLSDGSIVVLNTSSQVDIHFTAQERRVRLSSGQAWFQVARNAARPFIVEAGNQRVTALGTAFDVRIDEHEDTVQVALAEGRVSVEPIHLPWVEWLKPKAKPAELVAGETLIASREGPVNKQKADVARIASWREGHVVFDNDSLEAAVAEINRYSSTHIELADPALGAYRVSGVFKAGNSESFIETLTGHYPIRVAERADGLIVLAARTNAKND